MGMGLYIKSLNKELSYACNNAKAWALEADSLKESALKFKMSSDEFELANDSLSIKMREVLTENRIKTKKIESLQYQLEHINKTETIYVRDTIFRTSNFVLDTCLIDSWSKTCLHLQYPNVVSINTQFENEKYIIFSHKREPIKPKKCKLAAWFARKHTVVEITVVDKNPHVTTPKQRFVEIINNKSK